MQLKALLGILLAAFLSSTHAQAADQIGIFGVQGFTNQNVLPNPTGFGVFLQRDLSTHTLLRISYSWGKDTKNFFATVDLAEGFAPGPDSVSDFWHREAKIHAIDLSLLLGVVHNAEFSLRLGPGLGMAKFDHSVTGKTSGRDWGGDSSFRLSFSALADFAITHRAISPLNLHLSARERVTVAPAVNCDDCPIYFPDSITSAELALALSYPF